MRQKILALELFKGKKPWDCARGYSGDYLDSADNKQQKQYRMSIQQLFSKGGDTDIAFADNVMKINRKGKSQLRTLIVTNANIYKYDPQKYTQKKDAVPLASVQGVFCSPGSDTFVVIKMADPIRDMVVDVGVAQKERVSELVSTLVTAVRRLTGESIPVQFSEQIEFNNDRAEGGGKMG